MTRDEFMEFFRDDDQLNTLAPDDRVEIFLSILTGSSDISKDLLDELLSDYDVEDLKIVEI